jgi:peptidoglycan/xylan/chitin deacetylase (PgdA/CDA1 family)
MKPTASVSFDIDNQWSYMKTHGDAGWESFPSYLDLLLPRVVDFLAARSLRITFMVVGQDAALDKNHEALGILARAGHEVGNHSFKHEPWLHRYSPAAIRDELTKAEEAIERATGVRPRGFRGPGFSVSTLVLETLAERGYHFDASTFPTYIGPLARAYYFMKSSGMTKQDRDKRKELFGSMRDGLRPLKPYLWDIAPKPLLEIPVTTLPGIKTPFHLSYILYLSTFSTILARGYFKTALLACRASGIEPSLLVHPLDFIGKDDVDSLAIFPGMQLSGAIKRERVSDYLKDMASLFDICPLGEHARRLQDSGKLRTRKPDFPAPVPLDGET